MHAFVCRQKPDGKTDLTDQALQECRIYYGLPDIPGLLDRSHTLESIRAEIHAVHPEYRALREAKMFWTFSREIRPGDLILVPKQLRKEKYVSYFIAEAVGDAYEVREYQEESTTYRRKVRWLNDKTALRKDQMSPELIDKINAVYNVRLTCLDVSEFASEVQRLINQPFSAAVR